MNLQEVLLLVLFTEHHPLRGEWVQSIGRKDFLDRLKTVLPHFKPNANYADFKDCVVYLPGPELVPADSVPANLECLINVDTAAPDMAFP
jgi:hypothetical protein